ncbi:MAG: FAD:protein FMN transferase [Chromatiaceae bacterium]|nr:MAG: FAD:protein FMN transferase [Chromatiaceae bacterium]
MPSRHDLMPADPCLQRWWPPAALLSLLLLVALLGGCRGAETPIYTTQFVAFDAAVDLSIVGLTKAVAQQAARDLERDLIELDQATHAWKPGPMVRVNELLASGRPFAAPPVLLPLIRQGQDLAARTGHLFNPAIGHLIDLWGFNTANPECRPPPADAAIARLVAAAPSMADLYLDGIMLGSDNPAVKLDFDGIAAGYALDLAVSTLRARGIRNAAIGIGGNVRVIGSRAGRPWRIPIRRASGSAVLGTLGIGGDASLFTAGTYRRNFIHDGRLYHNIIDPRSGRPASGFKAVTVLHRGDAATAQAAANALMVAGPMRWAALADALGLDAVLLVDADDTLHMTPTMAAELELLDHHHAVQITDPAGLPEDDSATVPASHPAPRAEVSADTVPTLVPVLVPPVLAWARPPGR